MPADDLFAWIDSLWTKRRPAGVFPVFVASRFLSSDRDLAMAAREFNRDLREPDLIWGVWAMSLPRGKAAPRLQYVAAKKLPEAEALTARMMAVLNVRRSVVEQMQALVAAAGREAELYQEFGIEHDT